MGKGIGANRAARVRAEGGQGRGSGGPWGPPGPAPRVLRVCSRAGRPAAASGQSGRASGEGRGLPALAPRVLLFAHTRIQRAIRPSGILFPFFFSLILCVFSNFFKKIEICGNAGVRKLLLRGMCAFPHFFFCLSSSFFFLVKVLNIPRS